jgi:hypothetical protein
MRVMRAGRGLRVILHAEQRQIPMPQAFQSLVVQVDVRQLDFALASESGSTAKLWLCAVISIFPVFNCFTG